VQILARTPHSVLWLQRYPGHEHAVANLRSAAAERGLDPRRLLFTEQTPWVNHTLDKVGGLTHQ
jgi:predicted O-linked N-acetylglucosamine transferase (SPINDLY family)